MLKPDTDSFRICKILNNVFIENNNNFHSSFYLENKKKTKLSTKNIK